MSETLRETMLRQLLRGVLDEDCDLASRRAVDAYLIRKGFRLERIRELTAADVGEVRRRLRARMTIQDRCDAVLERIEESGCTPVLLVAGIALVVLCLWRMLQSPAHAFTLQAMGARHATAVGLLLMLLPIAIAAILLTAALRAVVKDADDAAGRAEKDAR